MKRLIDIYLNIMYTYSASNYLDVISDVLLERKSPSNLLHRIWFCIEWITRDIVNPFRTLSAKMKMQESDPTNKFWIFADSKNQFDSCGFLLDSVKDAILVVPTSRKLEKADYIFPYYSKIFFYGKLPFLWLGLLFQNHPISYRYFNFLFEAIGIYEISLNILKKYLPKAIIFSNDHSFKHRALFLAAKKLDIRTCYIQHASVSSSFPPLSFDLSLLEGNDSLKKYQECGDVKSEIKLVGMPKFDKYVNLKKKPIKNIKIIGIAANLSDDLDEIIHLTRLLNDSFNMIKILLRLHPRDKRIVKNNGIIFDQSDSSIENAFDFLARLDLLISGESSIHLEAALLHVPSIIYGFNSKNQISDYYGYVKNGLIQKAEGAHIMIDRIKIHNFKVNIDKLKYYNEVIGTQWEGKSKQLISQILKEYLI